MLTEFKIETDFGTLAAKRWGVGTRKVLVMHGWLDNAASFDVLAPLLADTECVVVDFLGHGLSDHLPGQRLYSLDLHIQGIEQVIDFLGWATFSVLGHSLGAIVGSCIAADSRFSKRVDSLISLDALGPLSAELMASDHPAVEVVDKMRSRRHRAPRIYESVEQMYQSRARANQLDTKFIKGLVERGAKAVNEGWMWRFDPKLLIKNKLKYVNETAVFALLKKLTCPVALIRAKHGILPRNAGFNQRLAMVNTLYFYELDGGHHVHLEAATQVANCIQEFWQQISLA
ncbi:alpha/beta fold hydrolase [Piscirickettsia salmonis]|uniref:alpha/beta fold hydrolase n=1 Tax=Piscirickettsia salmonis TaxID=1238 RepID=UPI0007C8F065|nr:short chain dehydrogenase [Piscirickettsiaceae bacterium NZ-RLO1]